jgi:catecholate siderophore receptor
MKELHYKKVSPLSVAIAMIFTIAPASLIAAEMAQSEVAQSKPAKQPAEAPANDQALATVNVTSTKQNEVVDGYQATKTRVGKLLQDPHDIPQAMDFPRFSRQLIMSEITKRKLNERHQIYRRV